MNINIKYFLTGLFLSVILSYIIGGYNDNNGEVTSLKNSQDVIVVETGSIKKSIEVVGDAELVDEQSLTFNKVGTVTNVYFKEGDTVRKGETIARLDDSDAYRSIEDAKLSLANAKINLSQLYEAEDDSKVKQSKNSILVSETNYNTSSKELINLKITQENALLKLTNEILNYKEEIENTKKEKENNYTTKSSSKNTTVINIEDNFKTYLINIEDIIDSSDVILGVSEDKQDDNDEYETYLGAKDTATKNNADASLRKAFSLYKVLKSDLESYSYSGSKDEIVTLLNSYLVVYNHLYDTTDLLYKTLDNSIVSIGSLSSSDLTAMKQSISQARSTTLSKVDSINSDINSINSLIDTDLELSSSELTIQKMETILSQLISDVKTVKTKYEIEYESKIKEVEDRKENLEIAKVSLEELLEGPTESNVSKSKNSITQAELKLASAYEDLEDYILTAPFDGVVRKIDYMSGDNLKDDNDKYVYIENPNLLEVSVMLDQIDIVNVKIGDIAIIIFDSYATIPVDAKISNIDTTPLKNSGVVSYEVKLILDDPDFDKKVLSGMTADVEIINELKENILLLKTSAITTLGDKKIVLLNKNGKQEQVEIKTGLSSDGKTEIISGLEEGNEIIVGEFSIGSEEASSTLFSTPGSGRGEGRPPQ